LFLATWCALGTNSLAFDPPVDQAGPLRAEIEGPAEVTQTGQAVGYTLRIENHAEQPITGTVEFRAIDDWRVDREKAETFRIAPRGKLAIPFSVFPGPETYPAHYPIHAFVRFEHEGQQHLAHPILIVDAKVPARPVPRVAPPWQPFELLPHSAVRLWEVAIFRVGSQVFGRSAEMQRPGWEGTIEPHRGSTQTSAVSLGGISRSAIGMHPPWFGGQVGTIWREIPLKFPAGVTIRLRFYAAVTPTGQGDGVTFRVRAAEWDQPDGHLGEVLFESHVPDKSWRPVEVDLSALAGRTVRLQLESHPGPQNNTGWDQSYWGEPVLEIGSPAPTGEGPVVKLGTATWGDEEWSYLLWPGRRGWMDAAVAMQSSNGKEIRFRGFQLRVLGVRVDDAQSPFPLLEVRDESTGDGRQVRHRLQSPFGPFDLLVGARVEDGVLRFSFRLENTPPPRPFWAVYLEDIAVDQWTDEPYRVYAGHGNVVQKPGYFSLGFDGHRLASSFVGLEFPTGVSLVQAVDLVPTQLLVDPSRRHASLHVAHQATMSFIPHTIVWKAAGIYRESVGLRASSGVPVVAGRFVFDLWGGQYHESAKLLELAFRYGLTDSMVLWHNWQRWGYDYRLPEIFPPNPRLGTLEDMQELAEVCRRHGVLFGLHDNYIDFYPDAEGFSYKERIAFHQSGLPVRAWFNEGRQAQSYRFRADQVEPFLRSNLALIKQHIRPTAYFIDVWASIQPYDYWTADGRFFDRVYTRNSWGEHFAWIREFLGDNAPQLSESGHDQLVGWLDGATANHLRVGPPATKGRYQWSVWNWPCEDAERVPWLDAVHHHRFILHGAGYSQRYQAGLDPRLHGIYSDDYICTEVLTGHPAMVPAPFGHDVVRKYWLTQPVARALALRKLAEVKFHEGDLHRQVVTWEGGATIWVNRGKTDWNLGSCTLPPFGFLAKISSPAGAIEAGITRREGIITEWCRCPDWLYVNGRKPAGSAAAIRLRVERVDLNADENLELSLIWELEAELPEGYRPFLHFCDEEGEILFQAAVPGEVRGPLTPRILKARATAAKPAGGWKSGRFELRAGFYDPRSGRRLPLVGPDDGTTRIRIGTVEFRVAEGKPTSVRWEPLLPEDDPILVRQNPLGREIDFGPIITAGGCRLQPRGSSLVVTPLPDSGSKAWRVRLRWSQLPWQLPLPRKVCPLAPDGSRQEAKDLRFSEGFVELLCEPGIFAYELSP
jgi:hypothetical protein